jgi:hypothetical protein
MNHAGTIATMTGVVDGIHEVVDGPTHVGKEVLLQLVATSLSKGHRKVAAQRTLMLLYRYEEAPETYVKSMTEVLSRCSPAEAARMRRASIEWARIFRGWYDDSSAFVEDMLSTGDSLLHA